MPKAVRCQYVLKIEEIPAQFAEKVGIDKRNFL